MSHEAKPDTWRGVKEGLEDLSVFQYVRTVGTRLERLGGEEGLGEFHLCNVAVDDQNLQMVIQEWRVACALRGTSISSKVTR